MCGFGPDLVGIHSLSLAARYRVGACSTSLGRGLLKISTASQEFLFHPWPFSTVNAFKIVCRLDRKDTLDDVPQQINKKLPLVYFMNKTLLGFLFSRSLRVRDRSVVIVLLTSCPTWLACFSLWVAR